MKTASTTGRASPTTDKQTPSTKDSVGRPASSSVGSTRTISSIRARSRRQRKRIWRILTPPFYFGNGYRVDRAGRKLAEFFPGGQVHFRRDTIIFGLNCVLQPSTFIRRSALEEVGRLDDTLHYGFDSNLWIELSALGRPSPIRTHLSASREYGETKTSTGSFGRADELRRIADLIPQKPDSEEAVLYLFGGE